MWNMFHKCPRCDDDFINTECRRGTSLEPGFLFISGSVRGNNPLLFFSLKEVAVVCCCGHCLNLIFAPLEAKRLVHDPEYSSMQGYGSFNVLSPSTSPASSAQLHPNKSTPPTSSWQQLPTQQQRGQDDIQPSIKNDQRRQNPRSRPSSELSFAELPRHGAVVRQQLQRLKDEVALLQVLLCFSCRISNQASPNTFLQLMQAEAMKERDRIVNESRFFNQFVVPLFVSCSHQIFRNFRSIAAEQDEVC